MGIPSIAETVYASVHASIHAQRKINRVKEGQCTKRSSAMSIHSLSFLPCSSAYKRKYAEQLHYLKRIFVS